jgi:hypothetical protein
MASIIKRPNGHRWIQFTDNNGNRKTIRLGKANARSTSQHRNMIECILANKCSGIAMEQEVARFIGELPTTMRRRYENAGLIAEQVNVVGKLSVTEYVDNYFSGLKSNVKPGTWTFYQHTCSRLKEFFGVREMASISGRRSDVQHMA